jgi:hypothetical protein
MSLLGFYTPSERTGFFIGSAVLVVIGVALLALPPPKQSVEQPSSASAWQRALRIFHDAHASRLADDGPLCRFRS